MASNGRTPHTDALARYLTKRERVPPNLVGTTTAGGNSIATERRLLPAPIGDPGQVLTVVTNGDGDDVASWEDPAASGTITVQEGDVDVDTAVTTIDFDASDFNISSSPAGEANVALNYGTGAGQPAEGNHTHAGSTITVQEEDSTVVATASVLDFDGSDFNVSESPSGEANISLAYGTSAGTPAEGNHVHANDHVAATVLDSSSIDLGISGQQITAAIIDEYVEDLIGGMLVDGTGIDFSYNDGANTITAEPIFAGSGSAGTVAHSDHTHAAGGAAITVQEEDSTVSSVVTTLDFKGSEFDITESPSGEANIALATAMKTFNMQWVVSEGGVPTTGRKHCLQCPVDATAKRVYVGADTSGDLTIDFWKDTHANWIPTNSDSMPGGGTHPSMTGASSIARTDLTGGGDNWGTTSVTARDWICLEVETAVTITEITVVLELERT